MAGLIFFAGALSLVEIMSPRRVHLGSDAMSMRDRHRRPIRAESAEQHGDGP